MLIATRGKGGYVGLVPIRLRLPELLEERDLTAYEVARRSGGRIDASALYRLVRQRGRVARFSAPLIDALCDVLGVAPSQVLARSRAQPVRRVSAIKAARRHRK